MKEWKTPGARDRAPAARGPSISAPLAVVEEDRQAEPPRAVEHPLQDLDLLVPRRMVVVEVEADLADRGDVRPPRERLERGAVAGGIEVLRLVGMDADRGKDAFPLRGQLDRGGRIGERRAGHEEPRHTGRPGAREEVIGAVPQLQVTVGIGEQLT